MEPKQTKKTNPKLRQRLLNSSFNYLKYRDRSEHEIRQHLEKKTSNTEAINLAIQELCQLNLIDDQKFAIWFANSRIKQSKGPRLIQYELAQKYKIDRQTIKKALSQIDSQLILNSALKHLHKKTKKLSQLPQFKAKLKAKQLLYQRGFYSQTITFAIDEYLNKE